VSRFDRDTAVTPLGGGRFSAAKDTGWWIERGPNGGYLAAVLLRALAAALPTGPGAARSPRSLTIHYLAPPAQGPVEISVVVERHGRQMSFTSGRMTQGERLLALAVGAFAVGGGGPSFADAAMPVVAPAIDLEPMVSPPDRHIPLRDRYDSRWAIGPLPYGRDGMAPAGAPSDGVVAGGWIRLADPHPYDHALLAAVSDAWLPPVFAKVTERLGVPTIDLTVHFRADLASVGLQPDDFVLTSFRSRVAADGFIEEDGEIWSPSGVLLAQSRQLALLLPM
jgi:acyl-CoA thioesterase